MVKIAKDTQTPKKSISLKDSASKLLNNIASSNMPKDTRKQQLEEETKSSSINFETFLTTPIKNYCLIENGNEQLKRHMSMYLAQSNNIRTLFGNGINGRTNMVSDEVSEYDYSYAKNVNYLNNYQKNVAKNTRTKIGAVHNGYQNYNNGNTLYSNSVNSYYDDNGTGIFKTNAKISDSKENNHKDSILKKTKQLFGAKKIKTIISRFHTEGNGTEGLDETATARTQYGYSHGRNLLTYNAEKNNISYATNGYDNPYCRVWTHHHQYTEQRDRLMRPFYTQTNGQETGSAKTNQDIHKWGDRFKDMEDGSFEMKEMVYSDIDTKEEKKYLEKGDENKWGWKDSGADGWEHSVLNDGNLNIAPKFGGGGSQNIHPKDCMFSIENLAWKDYDPYSFETALSWEQRGPFGGRIMWFPPYGLRFNEESTVNWNEHSFIGRGENVFTYTNTSRSGTLEFMMVVDHPSILDYATWHENTPKDTDVLRFFAGCDDMNPKSKSSLLSYVKPTPLTDEYLRLNELVGEPEKAVEKNSKKKEDEDKQTDTTEGIEVTFYVFFPNNYSGYFDRQGESVVHPIAYLLYGKGAQWKCNDSDPTKSTSLELGINNKLQKNCGNGYEMHISKSHVVEQDREKNYIIGCNGNAGNVYKDNKTKKYYYRIDGEYKAGLTTSEVKNTFAQVLPNQNSYKDNKTYNLNSDYQQVKTIMNDVSKNLYSFAEVAYVLLTNVKDLIKTNAPSIVENSERLGKLQQYFDTKSKTYKITEISGVGYSNSHGQSNKKHTERNKFLAQERYNTVVDWLKKTLNLGDDVKVAKEQIESGVDVEKTDKNNESGENAKKYRSVKMTIKISVTKTEDVPDSQKNDNSQTPKVETKPNEESGQGGGSQGGESGQGDGNPGGNSGEGGSQGGSQEGETPTTQPISNLNELYLLRITNRDYDDYKQTYQQIITPEAYKALSDESKCVYGKLTKFSNDTTIRQEQLYNYKSGRLHSLRMFVKDGATALNMIEYNALENKDGYEEYYLEQIPQYYEYDTSELYIFDFYNASMERVGNYLLKNSFKTVISSYTYDRIKGEFKDKKGTFLKNKDLIILNPENFYSKATHATDNFGVYETTKYKLKDDCWVKAAKGNADKQVITKEQYDASDNATKNCYYKYYERRNDSADGEIKYENGKNYKLVYVDVMNLFFMISGETVIYDSNAFKNLSEEEQTSLQSWAYWMEVKTDADYTTYELKQDCQNNKTSNMPDIIAKMYYDIFPKSVRDCYMQVVEGNSYAPSLDLLDVDDNSNSAPSDNNSNSSNNDVPTDNNKVLLYVLHGADNNSELKPLLQQKDYDKLNDSIKKLYQAVEVTSDTSKTKLYFFKKDLTAEEKAKIDKNNLKEPITPDAYDKLSKDEQKLYQLSDKEYDIQEILKEETPPYKEFEGFEHTDKKDRFNRDIYVKSNRDENNKLIDSRAWVYNEQTGNMEHYEDKYYGRWSEGDQKFNQFDNLDKTRSNNNTLRYDQEYRFFKKLQEKDPVVFESLVKKLQYFDPAFHSMTPEGFMGRLNFLHQCTRQGDTNSVFQTGYMANNLAFGRPPFCILRLGDFYYQKIVIKNINITYDPLVWDLNNEGVGVVPLIANVTISFNFIGGGDLTGPVRRLQNANSYNFYANGRLYDNRADRMEYDSRNWATNQAEVDWKNSHIHRVDIFRD